MDREYFVKMFEAIFHSRIKASSVLVIEKLLLNFCSISDSLPAHSYLYRCQVVAVTFSVTLCCCGLLLVIFIWISQDSCDGWSLFAVPKTKIAKIPYMFYSVVLTCAHVQYDS